LVPFTVASPPRPQSKDFNVPLIGTISIDNYSCGSKASTAYTVVLVAYKVLLTIAGAIFAFRVRSLGECRLQFICLCCFTSLCQLHHCKVWFTISQIFSCCSNALKLMIIFLFLYCTRRQSDWRVHYDALFNV
jgi:hypothetical protein